MLSQYDEVMRGQQFVRPPNSLSRSVELLARWWTQAQQGERFALVRAALQGEGQAPDFASLQIAIYLAEIAAGEVEEG